MSSEQSGSLIDDAAELIRWRPVLPLLHQVRSTTGVAKLVAIRDALAFILKQSYGTNNPYSSPAFATFALVVELAQSDARVLASIERLLPKEKAHERGFAPCPD